MRTSMIPIRNVNHPNPIPNKLSDARTASPMDMISKSRPVPKVGPKNLDGLRDLDLSDIGAYMSSKPDMLGNRAVTPNASPELHRKQECISSPSVTCS